jgi:hypothetical protein
MLVIIGNCLSEWMAVSFVPGLLISGSEVRVLHGPPIVSGSSGTLELPETVYGLIFGLNFWEIENEIGLGVEIGAKPSTRRPPRPIARFTAGRARRSATKRACRRD